MKYAKLLWQVFIRFPSVQDCHENVAGSLEEEFMYQMPGSKSQDLMVKASKYLVVEILNQQKI